MSRKGFTHLLWACLFIVVTCWLLSFTVAWIFGRISDFS